MFCFGVGVKDSINFKISILYWVSGTFDKFKIYNPGKNIWKKIEKSGKTGQDKKILVSTFACFVTAIVKV